MITFTDGPAAGVELSLARQPLLLRVVRSAGGEWDALDQLDDVARPRERIFLYRLTAPAQFHGWIDFRTPGGFRRGQRLVSAAYAAVPDPPADAVLRDNAAWAAWCEANRERLTPAWARAAADGNAERAGA
ncbi:MAG TPA: hypothetical protein VF796_18755 [Humisphaera sp.]